MPTRFYLETRKGKSGDLPIRLSVSVKGEKRLLTTIGISIQESKWNSKRQEVKQGCSNGKGIPYNVINARIDKIRSHYVQYEFLSKEKRLPLCEDYDKYFRDGKKAEVEKTAMELGRVIDLFCAECGRENNWTKTPYDKFNSLKNHLSKYKPALKVCDFSKKTLDGLEAYFEKQGLKNTTIKKMFSLIKWFMRWALVNGYTNNDECLRFKPKLKVAPKKVVYLTWDELMKVYTFEFPEAQEHLSKVRDVFCFCAFTSLRYSDVANLTASDVKDGYISITTVKTADSLKIELNKYSQSILDKYKGKTFGKGLVLPVISNQKMNYELKDVGRICGIDEDVKVTYYRGNQRVDEVHLKWELIGTHTARRTFICNALMMGISPNVVMSWTGHSDYQAMKPYIAIADEAKAEAMKAFDKR